MAYVASNLNEIVAMLPVVQKEVRAEAYALEARIRAIIAPHTKTGHLIESVEVSRAPKGKDYYVSVGTSYVLPINYGFVHNITHKRIEGINFIKGAVYG